jgi:two-component system response regulator AtoC
MPSVPPIVVCDDERAIRYALSAQLQDEGYATVEASDGAGCLRVLREHGASLLLLDLSLPDMHGLELLRRLRQEGRDVPVIVVTAHGAIESAMEATRLGAAGYLCKPVDLREVTLAVERALRDDRLRQEVHVLRSSSRPRGYGELIGRAPSLQPVFETLHKLEDAEPGVVLITGESGTGKDVLARAVHARGPRKEAMFVEVDCAALPEQLVESELFGHEAGAFTDARGTKRGLFEVAGTGVVFLDEIGELAAGTQAKLLRALENRTFRRLGGVAPLPLAAMVIAATHRDLRAAVAKGTFRGDLFYRLDVIRLHLPPLRERAEDIPALVAHFVARFAQAFRRAVVRVDAPAMLRLQQHRWPGNVRELRNVIERMVLLAEPEQESLRAQDLPPEIRYLESPLRQSAHGPRVVLPPEGVSLEEVERELILQALERTGGNQSAAARLLQITRHALRYRMEKHQMAAPDESE